MGLDELTDRERAVAVAARTGASAKAIGEQLFLSPRTVETHLGAIYRKLGVTTRGELIALLHTQPDPPAPAAQLALPVMLPVTDGFVGRAAEIAALGSSLAAARRGERATVMIGGEPGIGKSTLAGRVAADAHASGALVLAGRCDPDFGAPFGPVADALRPYLGSHADPAKAGGPTAGSLAALLPELAARLPAPLAVEDAATSRRLLVEAVRHVLREAAAAAPVLLVLEDLHWADRATIALVRQLVTAAQLAGLVLVTDAAGRLVAPLYAGGSWTLSRDWLRPPTLAYLAPVARAVLDERARTALAEELAPYGGQLVVAGPGALVVDAVDHGRGILLTSTEPAAATALLTAAAALAEHVGSPVLADRSRRELAGVSGG
ncbi:MAG: AAA family ATPase [Jatrophihabitantaceae bacterium]